MSRRLAILCPGQGAQHQQMFDLARRDQNNAHVIDSWKLPAMKDLFSNQIAQPLVVGATCAMWQALGNSIPRPHIVAGYSVGELSALAVAGVVGAPQAIALASSRARLMSACVNPVQPQALIAVAGVTHDLLIPFLSESDAQAASFIAIKNGIDQFIVGGLASDLASLQMELEAIGGRIQVLPVAVASHTPFMRDAVAPLTRLMQNMALLQPRHGWLSGVSAQLVREVPAVIDCIALQMIQTVQWSACMDTLAEAGISTALELGPGCALSRMLAARYPHIACRSVADFRSISAIVAWLERAWIE